MIITAARRSAVVRHRGAMPIKVGVTRPRIPRIRRVPRGPAVYSRPMIHSVRAGDPGLFSFVGDIVKSIPGVGTVVSAVETGVKAIGGLLGGGGARASTIKTQAQPQAAMRMTAEAPSLVQRTLGGAQFGLTVGPVGLEAGVGEVAEAAQMLRRNGRGMLPPAGYHWNKAGYYVRDSSDPMRGIYVPPGTVAVKNRRRNPFNPRALDRATSRIAQFARADSRSRKAVVAAARKVTPPRRVAKGRKR